MRNPVRTVLSAMINITGNLKSKLFGKISSSFAYKIHPDTSSYTEAFSLSV